REHAVEALEQILAVVLVEMTDDFAVGACAKAMPLPLELTAQLRVIVDFPVVEQGDGPVGVEQRLVAMGDVVDGETSHAALERPVGVVTVGVRAAMAQRLHHAVQHVRRYRALEPETGDTAHGY